MALDRGAELLRRELEKIYDSFGQQLFTCAVVVTGCPDMAEDAIQDAFCRLMEMESRPRDLKAYAFRSVRNAAVDLVRRNGRTVSLDDGNAAAIFDFSDNPRQSAQKREFEEMAAEALKTLSDDERETVVQHLYADLGFREIAELRNVPMGTVASWYRRGAAKLREQLEGKL